ncbi:MAG: coenzyme F420-0:L-glutamate ligase [Actinomycetes bacterium]
MNAGRRLEVVALPTDVRVGPGDDVAALLLDAAAGAGVTLEDGDVLCVASKVLSKAAGATVPLPDAPDVHAARRVLAAREARRVVAETPWVLVVETRHGFVCANAGIDTSNLDAGPEGGASEVALLLPDDPDADAAVLRRTLAERAGVDVGVVVTDTFGRPWRLGLTDVALGAAGIVALRDDRGTTDLAGRALEVTMVALGDEVAAAADLVRSKADGTPFVLLRGLDLAGDGRGADLVRPSDEDVFRAGGPTAAEAALLPDGVPWPRPDGSTAPLVVRVSRVLDATPAELGGRAPVRVEDDPLRVVLGPVPDDGWAWVGAAVARLRVLLDAHGVAVAVARDGDPVELSRRAAGP